jgi:hypothetical protein
LSDTTKVAGGSGQVDIVDRHPQPVCGQPTTGGECVPRLSIIVPFQHRIASLEATLLSLLENRPHDCEVVLVHADCYHDPYQLDGDELLLINAGANRSLVALANEGLAAAAGRIVHVLLPGTTVESGWWEQPMELLADDALAAVSCRVRTSAQHDCVGWSSEQLPKPMAVSGRHPMSDPVAPQLIGSFYRRKVLLALQGWLEQESLLLADLDFGLALRSLDLASAVADQSRVDATQLDSPYEGPSYARGQRLGQLAVAYAELPRSGVRLDDNLVAKLGQLATALSSPQGVAERLGWVIGSRNHSLVEQIGRRMGRAGQLFGGGAEIAVPASHRYGPATSGPEFEQSSSARQAA